MDQGLSPGADQIMKPAPQSTATPIFQPRATCRACESHHLMPILDLGVQYLPRFVPEADTDLPKAPLELIRCAECGLLQLAHTVDPDLLYREFWYRSGINESMRASLADIVRVGEMFFTAGAWLDIGANDGYLLSCVSQEFRKVAVEPALNFASELQELADHVVSDYFTAKATGGERFNVITSAAMFYDLDRPGPFLDDIYDSLTEHGIWINQLNDAPSMLQQNAFDAICHEHVCYYDAWSLDALYRRHGLLIESISFNETNGSSMRVIARRASGVLSPPVGLLGGIANVSSDDAEAFAKRVRKWRHVFGNLIANIGPHLWAYGASTKGSTLMQYLDMHEYFEAVADRNARKHGLRMVGTWLPIKSEAEFREAAPRYALALPWAFKPEFDIREAHVRAAGTTFLYPLPDIGLVL